MEAIDWKFILFVQQKFFSENDTKGTIKSKIYIPGKRRKNYITIPRSRSMSLLFTKLTYRVQWTENSRDRLERAVSVGRGTFASTPPCERDRGLWLPTTAQTVGDETARWAGTTTTIIWRIHRHRLGAILVFATERKIFFLPSKAAPEMNCVSRRKRTTTTKPLVTQQ